MVARSIGPDVTPQSVAIGPIGRSPGRHPLAETPRAVYPWSVDLPAEESRETRRSPWPRVLPLLLGVALLAGFVVAAGPARIVENIASVGWGFLYLLLVSTAWRCIASTAMWLLLDPEDDPERRVPWWRVNAVRWAGESLNTLLPFGNMGGEPLKAVMLSEELGGARSTGIVVLDKTIFFISGVFFMSSGVLVGVFVLIDRPVILWVSLALILPWVALLAWAIRHQIAGDLVVRLSRLLSVFRVRLSEKRLATLAEVDGTLSTFWREHRGRFLGALTLHTFGRGLRAVDVWLCVWAMGLHIDWTAAYFTAAAGMLVTASLTFIPGQIGASEGGHALAFELIGLGFAAGVSVGLIRRIRNYMLSVVGYAVFVVWSARRG